jgi:Protein of unknown function (DUF3754)
MLALPAGGHWRNGTKPMSSERAGDGFIAVRKGELAGAIIAEGGFSQSDAAALGDVFKLLGAILHFEAHDDLEALKSLYDPLDADAPPTRRDASPAAFEAFETALAASLERANFREIDSQSVQTLDATKALTGLDIKASPDGIRRIRFFARGGKPERFEVKSWFGLRTRIVEAEVFADVVVLVGFKNDSEIQRNDKRALQRLRRGVRPGAALVKHFRNVAHAELVTLHPGAKPNMRPRDRVFLAVPALAGGVPVLINLWPALTVVFALIAAYLGTGHAIENDELRRALASLSGLIAVGAFVMRQRMKFEAQSLKYQKQLSETVYFRNLANNAGVLDLLISAGEEQDAKEALIAYGLLLRAGQGMGRGELDMAAEAFLRDRLKLDVDFEIGDALGKLERLGLIVQDGDSYRATPAADALANLDAAWDSYFKFARAPA